MIQGMKKSIRLFSRDERTFYAFRQTWYSYLLSKNYSVKIANRYEIGSVKSFFSSLRRKGDNYIMFGTSEIILYAIVSNKQDFWVFTGLGRLLQEGTILASLVLLYLKINYRGQKIIVLNKNDKIILEYTFGPNVFQLSGEGYDFNVLNLAQSGKTAVNQGIYNLNFCYFGRLLKSKGVEVLIDSFLSIENKRKSALNLYGDFDFSNSDGVHKKYHEIFSDVTNTVSHHGYVEDVLLKLSENHVFVSMSKREGLSFAVLEALYMGLTVLLSPVAGNLEFKHFEGVYYVDAENLPSVIEGILNDPGSYLLTQASVISRRTAIVEKFGSSAVKNELSMLFQP